MKEDNLTDPQIGKVYAHTISSFKDLEVDWDAL